MKFFALALSSLFFVSCVTLESKTPSASATEKPKHLEYKTK